MAKVNLNNNKNLMNSQEAKIGEQTSIMTRKRGKESVTGNLTVTTDMLPGKSSEATPKKKQRKLEMHKTKGKRNVSRKDLIDYNAFNKKGIKLAKKTVELNEDKSKSTCGKVGSLGTSSSVMATKKQKGVTETDISVQTAEVNNALYSHVGTGSKILVGQHSGDGIDLSVDTREFDCSDDEMIMEGDEKIISDDESDDDGSVTIKPLPKDMEERNKTEREKEYRQLLVDPVFREVFSQMWSENLQAVQNGKVLTGESEMETQTSTATPVKIVDVNSKTDERYECS